jgi:hypothetical protein
MEVQELYFDFGDKSSVPQKQISISNPKIIIVYFAECQYEYCRAFIVASFERCYISQICCNALEIR